MSPTGNEFNIINSHRNIFLERLKSEVLHLKSIKSQKVKEKTGLTHCASIADISSPLSVNIAMQWCDKLPGMLGTSKAGQTAGTAFEESVRDFLSVSFEAMEEYRPGPWMWNRLSIDNFDQYGHLKDIADKLKHDKELKSIFAGDYIITPDVLVYREPIEPSMIGGSDRESAKYTPFLKDSIGAGRPLLLASISCKLTLRSDRAQNARTEALNLMRNRKGKTPHIVAVTAEPLPSRIASIALGTGDIDCTYHAGLYELAQTIENLEDHDDSKELINTMIEGRRLRDISDLPFDLAI